MRVIAGSTEHLYMLPARFDCIIGIYRLRVYCIIQNNNKYVLIIYSEVILRDYRIRLIQNQLQR